MCSAQTATPTQAQYQILASPKSGIDSVAGLKGTDIGVSQATVIQYVTERLLGAEGLSPQDITEQTIAAHLYAPDVPDPDLLIRTSGELRVSNFLLWQIAYAEIWVTETLWPDFRRRELLQAVVDYQKRERRYGRVAEETAPQHAPAKIGA